jgi:hypothetical protein
VDSDDLKGVFEIPKDKERIDQLKKESNPKLVEHAQKYFPPAEFLLVPPGWKTNFITLSDKENETGPDGKKRNHIFEVIAKGGRTAIKAAQKVSKLYKGPKHFTFGETTTKPARAPKLGKPEVISIWDNVTEKPIPLPPQMEGPEM